MKSLSKTGFILISGIILLSAAAATGLNAAEKIAPVFNLRNIRGELVKPFQEQKPIILSFFFTDCPKCRIEIRELEAFSRKYEDKVKVYLIGTSFKNDVDITDDVESFISELDVSFIPLVDKYKDVIKTYGVSTYPALFLIDSRGQIVFTSSAYNEKTMANLEKQIKSVK